MSAFHITGLAIVSFSGGRTSAYMLFRILEAHGGVLPADVRVVFANTGREMPATLDFVHECAVRWAVHVTWLEYRRDPDTGRTWPETVSHNSASREGEPFRQMLASKVLLPNPVMRFCTEELKVRPIKRWAQSVLGWDRWRNLIGLRADELHRVVRAGRRNATRKQVFRTSCPLAKARVANRDVRAFWAVQPFDLRLRGKWEGNCDLCFLKNLAAKRRMILDHLDRAEAWAWDEENAQCKGTIEPDAALYRKDVPSYRTLINQARDNPRLPLLDPDDDGMDPVASCDGCGV